MTAAHLNQNPDLRLPRAGLNAALTERGLDADALQQSHPLLFADAPVFVEAGQLDEMRALIAVIEAVIALPVFQAAALIHAPEIARHDPGYPAVCMGYDFHLTPAGARLIEINTNAGGLMLNAELARAQGGADIRADALAMFQKAYGKGRKRLAIVDTEPERQYLAPEFALFRRLFVAAGVDAFIADPCEFIWDGERLRHAGEPVDMVYNRLTDFSLADPEHAAVNAAYRAGAIVLTPHPRAHALYADKRNLCLISDPDWLAQAGISTDLQNTLLAGIPRTCEVTPENAEHFWQTRKEWFFKPAAGFGSRAAYRGDKLTHKVFDFIRAGDNGGYVAQRFAPPSTRRVRVAGEAEDRILKLDIRAYVFEGRVQLFAARLYQGQTTNFRTPGGGFAAVLVAE
ncbi:hypothetical protein AGMMS49545_12490 [Betaproteobacteria bacterium]|nr:hypothetical protein AGMMS49545_12490 [Betaproteobacteria bacterium]GHU45881.1 hypothetical protein AGMMS50289_18000 [Betaproteobacteria bacterium]